MSTVSDNNLFFLDDLTVLRISYNHVVNAVRLINSLASDVSYDSFSLKDIEKKLVASQESLSHAINLLEF